SKEQFMVPLPKILLVTEVPIDMTHGTGVQLMRLFATHDRSQILHVMPKGREGSPFKFAAMRRSVENEFVSNVVLRGCNRLSRVFLGRNSRWGLGFDSSSLESAATHFDPDLILGVVYQNDGLRLMEAVLQVSPKKPAVLWFHDLQLDGRVRDLQKLLCKLSEV